MKPSQFHRVKDAVDKKLCEVTLGNFRIVDVIKNSPSTSHSEFTLIMEGGKYLHVSDEVKLFEYTPAFSDAVSALMALQRNWPELYAQECVQQTIQLLIARQKELLDDGK